MLRDIKKWIRFYDQKTNRMDAARCLAESNLVGGDLLQILATWPANETDSRFKARIALACYEVMTPLTWPLDRDAENMTVNHHRHIPVLQLAQLGYKRAIINFDGVPILHAAVRVALPSMAVPIGDRTLRDHGIIKLVLYFIRNIAMISPPHGFKYDGDESQISRSATIDAFSYQDIFLTLLTISSNMGEDFRTEDVIILEILFHLVKRVDASKLFLNEEQLHRTRAGELTAVMAKEAAMLRSYKKNAPTRHNRFGTTVWVVRDDGKVSTLSGQDALADAAARELKMDNSKTFRPPRKARREDMEPKDLGPRVALNPRANDQLRGFVEEFLDSSFNPLFQHVRKTIDREASYVLHYHRAQFFYLVAWFLDAERARRKPKKSSTRSQDEVSSFSLVAGVLHQEMFITLARALDQSYNEKDWQELTTVMRCFTQILLTVQEMSESGNEENEEIAENILNRLFYEEATHDAIANIVRTFKDQGFEYLDACTDLAHTYMRILEAYSKQNVDLQVRSRRRARRKKKAPKPADTDDAEDRGDAEDDDSANDEESAQRTSSERKFDFKRFAQRFIPQGVVDTFVKFTKFYRDLDESQLKRAHRYFHRVAFKQEMSVMLFRVDIIHLFYNMIKGPEPLDKSSPMFKEWEELTKQIIKRCVRKMEERPALIIEMLFSKINATAHYLEYGYEKQTISTHPRPGAELEFRHIMERDRQVAVAVGVLLDKNQQEHIDWVKRQLASAESERRAWETAERAMASIETANTEDNENPREEEPTAKEADVISKLRPTADAWPRRLGANFDPALRPNDAAGRTAMFKNSHLRLLMKLVGFQRLAPLLEETPESVWVIPGNLTANQLKESLDLINKAEFDPPVFDNDESAEDQLRRKSAARKKAAFDDDDDGLEEDDDILFPAGGPTARKAADAFLDGKKKRRRRRRRNSDGDEAEEPTDEKLDERARLRREKELQKARKIKSELFVDAYDDVTDDERDREFFEREEALRQRIQNTLTSSTNAGSGVGPASKRKTTTVLLSDDSDEEPGGPTADSPATRIKRKRKSDALADGSEGDDDEREEPPASSGMRNKRKKRAVFVDSSDDEDTQDSHPSSQASAPPAEPYGSDRDGMETDDTPLSLSPHLATGNDGEAALQDSKAGELAADVDMDDSDDEDDVPKAMPSKRSRAKGGFIIDSSDEE